ncbi:type VI secretion system accessory protein TagJ [Pseudogemmobacter humi]|uniref:ImpE protein n=1 Tax=Pseudogemmobacter humi TaxID=2483812 RepID=A0A3P5XQQ9_9RHOB|nr:type VI secretion system accessory protein TagJ [Pseudogemmobacter humi]VDC32768.1 ImpE protein [Pseudogemmobacter humi]
MTPDAIAHLKAGDPDAALAALSAQVRSRPGDAKLRIFLFQLLCVQGDWQRAVTQLKLCAELDPLAIPMAQAYREAIICEVFRESVFAGEKRPLVFGEPQDWIALLLESLQALGQGRIPQAAELRARAFDSAPATPGSLNGTDFGWIADADSRLGPVLEAVIDGKYYWVPFNRLTSMELDPPEDLRDKVWMPARLRFANGGESVAMIPTRYAGTTARGDGAAKLALATEWQDAGGETWCGLGQRLFSTDGGDLALMDIRALRLGPGE